MAQRTKGSDDGNTHFTFRKNITQHKPGFEKAVAERETEAGNHRFKASDEKHVPKESLAARLAKSAKGG